MEFVYVAIGALGVGGVTLTASLFVDSYHRRWKEAYKALAASQRTSSETAAKLLYANSRLDAAEARVRSLEMREATTAANYGRAQREIEKLIAGHIPPYTGKVFGHLAYNLDAATAYNIAENQTCTVLTLRPHGHFKVNIAVPADLPETVLEWRETLVAEARKYGRSLVGLTEKDWGDRLAAEVSRHLDQLQDKARQR